MTDLPKPRIYKDRGLWAVETKATDNPSIGYTRVYYQAWEKAFEVATQSRRVGLLDAAWNERMKDDG